MGSAGQQYSGDSQSIIIYFAGVGDTAHNIPVQRGYAAALVDNAIYGLFPLWELSQSYRIAGYVVFE